MHLWSVLRINVNYQSFSLWRLLLNENQLLICHGHLLLIIKVTCYLCCPMQQSKKAPGALKPNFLIRIQECEITGLEGPSWPRSSATHSYSLVYNSENGLQLGSLQYSADF